MGTICKFRALLVWVKWKRIPQHRSELKPPDHRPYDGRRALSYSRSVSGACDLSATLYCTGFIKQGNLISER